MAGIVPTLVFLLVVIGVAVAVELHLRRQGYRHVAFPPPYRGVALASPRSGQRSFRGGLRIGLLHASWPLARLTADRDALQIRAWLLPKVWVPRSEVVAVRRVRSFVGPGVRFETASGAYDGVIFWTFSPGEVLAGLHALGWPVVRSS